MCRFNNHYDEALRLKWFWPFLNEDLGYFTTRRWPQTTWIRYQSRMKAKPSSVLLLLPLHTSTRTCREGMNKLSPFLLIWRTYISVRPPIPLQNIIGSRRQNSHSLSRVNTCAFLHLSASVSHDITTVSGEFRHSLFGFLRWLNSDTTPNLLPIIYSLCFFFESSVLSTRVEAVFRWIRVPNTSSMFL